jgi:hypothetical protein
MQKKRPSVFAAVPCWWFTSAMPNTAIAALWISIRRKCLQRGWSASVGRVAKRSVAVW